MKKIFFLLILLPLTISTAQVEYSAKQIGEQYNPKFYIDFVEYKSNIEAKPDVSSLIQVPYSSVQFKKNSNGYNAKYSVSLTFFDEAKKNVIQDKLWIEKIFTKDYKQTFSKNSFSISVHYFNLEPTTYTVVCVIEDQNSDNHISFQAKVKVRKFTKPIEISDVIFVKKIIKTKTGKSLVPNVSHIFSPEDKTIKLYYEIYSNKVRTVFIHNVIDDSTREKSSEQVQVVNLQIGKNPISSYLNETKLSLGNYSLVIKVKDEKDSTLTGIKNKFTVSLPYLPFPLKKLDDAIEQMKYIAEPSALDSIESVKSYDKKLKLFLAFWKKLDPDAATVENEVMNEYYRRVEYAKVHFKSYNNGWNTDRGMVYITLGPPDQVERNPMAIDTKPYEIWQYYNLNKQFVFQDETGFGDYRLLNPQYGEWNRYRK